MTTDIRNIFEQGYAEGYAAAEAKMAAFVRLVSVAPEPLLKTAAALAGNVIAESSKRPAKAIVAPKAPKAPTVARGVKKPALPHTKGVKEGIMNLIGAAVNGITVHGIVATTKFKESSVRATLMQLKKKGLATSDKGVWSLTPDAAIGYGNSESASHAGT